MPLLLPWLLGGLICLSFFLGYLEDLFVTLFFGYLEAFCSSVFCTSCLAPEEGLVALMYIDLSLSLLSALLGRLPAACEEQACSDDHDRTSADGEDRGTDATGGREGGEGGILNRCICNSCLCLINFRCRFTLILYAESGSIPTINLNRPGYQFPVVFLICCPVIVYSTDLNLKDLSIDAVASRCGSLSQIVYTGNFSCLHCRLP